jgi:hypothetical protein
MVGSKNSGDYRVKLPDAARRSLVVVYDSVAKLHPYLWNKLKVSLMSGGAPVCCRPVIIGRRAFPVGGKWGFLI